MLDHDEDGEIDLITLRRKPRERRGHVFIDDIGTCGKPERFKPERDAVKENPEAAVGLLGTEAREKTEQFTASVESPEPDLPNTVGTPLDKEPSREAHNEGSNQQQFSKVNEGESNVRNKSKLFKVLRYGSLEEGVDEVLVVQKAIHDANQSDRNGLEFDNRHKKSEAETEANFRQTFRAEAVGEHHATQNRHHFDASKTSCFNVLQEGATEAGLKPRLRQPDELLNGKQKVKSAKKAGIGSYTSDLAYDKLFSNLSKEEATLDMKGKEHYDYIKGLVKGKSKVQEDAKARSKPESSTKPGPHAKLEGSVFEGKTTDPNRERLENLLSSPENVELLESLLGEIKAKQTAKDSTRVKEASSYEWARNKVENPENALAKLLNDRAKAKEGFLRNRRGVDLFPQQTKQRGVFTLLRRLFTVSMTLAGTAFVGMLTLDIFFPEYLNTAEHMKHYELTERGELSKRASGRER